MPTTLTRLRLDVAPLVIETVELGSERQREEQKGGCGAKLHEGVPGYDSPVALTASSTLDAQKLRADFPIFEQQIHGKPLAYLDSAVSTHKPRQVLEKLTDFYETSYANVHRGVYTLSACYRECRTDFQPVLDKSEKA